MQPEVATEWLPWLHTSWRDSGMGNSLHKTTQEAPAQSIFHAFNTSM